MSDDATYRDELQVDEDSEEVKHCLNVINTIVTRQDALRPPQAAELGQPPHAAHPIEPIQAVQPAELADPIHAAKAAMAA